MAINLREISKKQKLNFAIVIVVAALIFYAVGIVTDLFANPAFSMFWIISENTAHNLAALGAVGSAIALVAIALIVGLAKKGKIMLPGIYNKQISRNIKAPSNLAVKGTIPVGNQKINNTPQKSIAEQKNQLVKQSIVPPTEQPTKQSPITMPPITMQHPTNENDAPEQEVKINAEGKTTCPGCKKAFSTPILMVDYNLSKPLLTRYCPYCNRSLGVEQEKQPPKPTEPNTIQDETSNQEPVVENLRNTCPACKKDFKTPIFMVDYDSPTPRLIKYCPYCMTSFGFEHRNAANEEIWNKYFNES